MSSEIQVEQERRAAELAANDPEFAAARPDAAVAAAIEAAGTQFPQVTKAVLEGYSDRPALAQRAYELVKDPQTGRTSAKLMPWFSQVTYGELAHRVDELSRALADGLVSAGDRVTVLGFTSIDYATIDVALGVVGAVSVPLQTSAAIAQLKPIVLETEPTVFAASVDYLSDAVDVILAGAEAGHTPGRLVVFDYRSELDDNREALQSAHERLADLSLTIETLNEVRERGAKLPATPAVEAREDDPLALLIYTSGSTGAPKGAMYPQSNVAKMWNRSTKNWFGPSAASISLNFMPMSHVMGRGTLYGTLGNGGTAYFAAKSDLSTLLEDLRLVRPTELNFVPRIWEMLYSEYHSEVGRRTAEGADRQAAESQVLVELRQELLGGRFIFAMTGSAPTSPELRNWVESLLEIHLVDGYGSTEAGMVLLDGEIQRPPVIDYKLIDVPDLGYFATDRPSPRGELLLKTPNMFPGYYKRPETTAGVFDDDGYYRTGDVFAETAPDRLVYVDRRNNVLKLAQGEFVTLAKLEAEFGNSPLIHQIYVYGNSAQPYLLAVVVPTEDAAAAHSAGALKSRIAESLQTVARQANLQSYEVPRDFIIETTPFSLENGLLTGIRKLAWPKLKQHYGERLEQLYADLAEGQANELSELRRSGADAPVLQTVSRAAAAMLGTASSDLTPDAHFTDLGGDSLSALTFGNLLHEIFDVDVPVGVIVSPANDLQAIANYIEGERQGSKRPTFAAVHGRDAVEVHAADLTLDKFLDEATLAAAPELPGPATEVRTVLLTGATGFLGRYLALEWLERMDLVDGKVIALVRAKSDEDARARLDKTFDSGDPKLLEHYQKLAADHLEVIAGDKGEANLGLDDATWQRLADTVDLIVDPAALVNHVLPYSELFGPNAVGTAELMRIALTSKLQAVHLRVDDRCGRPDSARHVRRGRRHPGNQRHPADQRRLRQRLRQQQVGRRGVAARGQRPVRAAGRGVPLRHDPGRHHLCGSAEPAGHVHPADAQPGRHRYRTRLVLRTRRGRQPATCPLRRAASGIHRRGDLEPGRPSGGWLPDLPRDEPVRRRHRLRRVRRLADRRRVLGPAGRRLRHLAATVRDDAAGPARASAPVLAAAAAAQLPEAADADQRVDGTDRSVPRRGARGENRSRQRHSACLGAGDRQVHHRSAVARTALT